jgi:hypothetical protein
MRQGPRANTKLTQLATRAKPEERFQKLFQAEGKSQQLQHSHDWDNTGPTENKENEPLLAAPLLGEY